MGEKEREEKEKKEGGGRGVEEGRDKGRIAEMEGEKRGSQLAE